MMPVLTETLHTVSEARAAGTIGDGRAVMALLRGTWSRLEEAEDELIGAQRYYEAVGKGGDWNVR